MLGTASIDLEPLIDANFVIDAETRESGNHVLLLKLF